MGWIRVTLAARKAAGDVKPNLTDMNKSLNPIPNSDDTRMRLFFPLLRRSFPGRMLSLCLFVELTWSWFGPRGRETSIVLRLVQWLLLAFVPVLFQIVCFSFHVYDPWHIRWFLFTFFPPSRHCLKLCVCVRSYRLEDIFAQRQRQKERKKDRMRTRRSMRRPFCACLKGRIR